MNFVQKLLWDRTDDQEKQEIIAVIESFCPRSAVNLWNEWNYQVMSTTYLHTWAFPWMHHREIWKRIVSPKLDGIAREGTYELLGFSGLPNFRFVSSKLKVKYLIRPRPILLKLKFV